MGTSTAGFTTDEDAYNPPAAGAAPGSSSSAGRALGVALFEGRPTTEVYGTSPFPPAPAPGARASSAASDSSSETDNLEIVSPALKHKLAVVQVGAQRTDSNLLAVHAAFKNKSDHSLPLEVETVYRDKADHSLSTPSAKWTAITLQPHEETQYQSVAVSEDATDFLVRVRRATNAEEAQP